MDKREEAKNLRKSHNFHDAIPVYKELWTSIPHEQWLGWEYAYCLKEVGMIDEAIKICKEVYGINKVFTYNNDLMAWCVYKKYFNKDSKISPVEIEKIASFLVDIIEQKKGSAFESIVFYMVNTFVKQKANSSYENALKWLNRLDVNKISRSIPTFRDSYGVEKEYQSNIEEYYSLKSKVLLKLRQYDLCIACCEEAEKEIREFHHDNDVWIAERKYYAMSISKKTTEYIEQLEKLYAKKNHWSILQVIGKIFELVCDYESVCMYYYRALASKDPIKMKVSLLYDTGKVLEAKEDKLHAYKHYVLCEQVRQKNDWGVNEELKKHISNCLTDEIPRDNVTLDELQSFWINEIKNSLPRYRGMIKRIFSSGKAGLIAYDRKTIYFKIESFLSKGQVTIDSNVSFCILDSYDKKKNIYTKEAYYIENAK